MRTIAVIALVMVAQIQAVAFAVQTSASGLTKPKAMLWQLIAPDGSKHLLLGTAHRLGLRLEQLPEVVGAIKQSNVLIGELSPFWGRQQHLSGSQAMFSEVEGALSTAIDQLNKEDDEQEESITLLQKLRNISNIIHKTKELQYDPSQWHALQRQLQTVGNMFLPSENTQVVAEGETRIDVGGTEVYFNPDKHLEFMVVQLLATALPELTTVYLTKQDAGETAIFHDPESSTANAQTLIRDLEEEYQQKLGKLLQQYGDSNPFLTSYH
ncbi:MAG: hypothetical protein OYH77_01605 [Pseudomonadota bacterium]|nr:hypothetical protein [Pseudomonadota bacterium]